MKLLFIVLLIIIISVTCILWIAGFIFANDFFLPSENIKKYKNVLLVFPHADDEVLNAGGLIHALSSQGSKVTLVILTKGERGTPDTHLDESLKQVRVTEARKAAKILGVTHLIQEDFGDDELINKTPQLTTYLTSVISTTKPDLVITYDESGLYGHPDHIVISEIITKLIKEKYTSSHLWYVSFPKRVLSMISLPEQMAKDPSFKNKRGYPTLKVFVPSGVLPKIQAVYAYKSQYESFRNTLPMKFIPLWFFYSMQQFEYFKKVN